MTHPKRKSIQHCFRISLQKFLIWLVLLGGGIGWLVSQAVRQEQIIESIEPFGQVLFDYQLDERGRRSKFEKSRPAWLKHPRSRSLFSSVVEFRSFGLTHSCFLDLYSQLDQPTSRNYCNDFRVTCCGRYFHGNRTNYSHDSAVLSTVNVRFSP